MNSAASNRINYILNNFRLLFRDVAAAVAAFWKTIPGAVRAAIIIVLAVAFINIIASIVRAVIDNRTTWKEFPNSNLMYSFLAGSGQFQRRSIKRDARGHLYDKTWSVFSFAGIAYRLGNYSNKSQVIMFLCSIAYVPLTILGMAEMLFRFILGTIVHFVLNLAYWLILLICGVINNFILIPIVNLADKTSWVTQHCPTCYTEFKLPVFECPHCGTKHPNLYPGRCGLFHAKCRCGHFIPCASFTKRKELISYCPNPNCGEPLVAANARTLDVQVIGGNTSGKTAYIAAFQHKYVEAVEKAGILDISCSPTDHFFDLEDMYKKGTTSPSSTTEVRAYSILHSGKGNADNGIVIYDTPDELLLSEQYERNPINFAYTDGVIIIVDPLSIRSVRKAVEAAGGSIDTNAYSQDSAEDIIVHFINKYSEVAGRAAKKMSDVPVAVVITKCDLTAVKRKIGAVKIKAEYNTNKGAYASLDDARNSICRDYLFEVGLGNAINNLDSVFSDIAYFPVSAIGHAPDGTPYDPVNVLAPVKWLAKQCHSSITGIWGIG